MSERYDREEDVRREAEERQRLGPNIDAEGRRMDDPRADDGPRPVGQARVERESRSESRRETREERGQQGARRRGNDDRGADDERGTSWISVIFGWLAALERVMNSHARER